MFQKYSKTKCVHTGAVEVSVLSLSSTLAAFSSEPSDKVVFLSSFGCVCFFLFLE